MSCREQHQSLGSHQEPQGSRDSVSVQHPWAQISSIFFISCYPMLGNLTGDAFCIISHQAHISIVNKSICHFSCSAPSQCTGLRGQKKHNKWCHVQILSQWAELNNLWVQVHSIELWTSSSSYSKLKFLLHTKSPVNAFYYCCSQVQK